MPGVVKFEFMEDGESYTALLCPLCVFEAKRLFAEARKIMKTDRLERRGPGRPMVPEP